MTNSKISNTDSNSIRFLLNDNVISVDDVEPTKSVLSYLRYDLGLVGTKEGCAEGDCGACTIVLAQLVDGDLQLRAVNACILLVPTLDDKAVYTVEYLRLKTGELHPVQQAMVDCHGSQCGFCTPGFIMSLWNVYVDHVGLSTVASDQQLRTALSGNLCRCTGYRPILEAGKKMFELPKLEFDRDAAGAQLDHLKRDNGFEYAHQGVTYHAPVTLDEFLKLRSGQPDATILAGCTDIGLWVNKQFRDLGDIIYIGNIQALKQINTTSNMLSIGAAVTLTDAFSAIAEHYPQIEEQWKRFASVPIRNAATLGGNIANGSPIGDSMPWLICLGAQVVLASKDKRRTIMLEDLYVDYMKKSMRSDEVLEAVEIPLNQDQMQFRTYKLSKRYDSDISAVCAAFALWLQDKKITRARIAFGGMAATPKRALLAEAALIGKVWDENTFKDASNMLLDDYSPMTDMRASAANRMTSAQNLFYRFYLQTRPDNPMQTCATTVYPSPQDS